MKRLSIDEHKSLMNYMSVQLQNLFEHENRVKEYSGDTPKDYFHAKYPLINCSSYTFGDCIAYRVNNSFFLEILRSYYPQALSKYPDEFKRGDAKAILQALYKVMPYSGWSFERFTEFLSNEISIYCVLKNDSVYGNILRIDLFRKLLPNRNKPERFDFVGGIFHLMKHFSIEGQNLSVGNDRNDIFDIENLIWLIICAFVEYIKTGKDIIIDDAHVLKAGFHKEDETGFFYINTLFKTKM